MRTLLRFLSLLCLALAVIVGVLDAARSIAAEAWVMAPLGVVLAETLPGLVESAEAAARESLPPFAWDPVATGLLALPAVAVFAGLSVVLAAAGRPRRRRPSPFAFRG